MGYVDSLLWKLDRHLLTQELRQEKKQERTHMSHCRHLTHSLRLTAYIFQRWPIQFSCSYPSDLPWSLLCRWMPYKLHQFLQESSIQLRHLEPKDETMMRTIDIVVGDLLWIRKHLLSKQRWLCRSRYKRTLFGRWTGFLAFAVDRPEVVCLAHEIAPRARPRVAQAL